MRHRKAGRKLNRNSSHRSSMMRNLAIQLEDEAMQKKKGGRRKRRRRTRKRKAGCWPFCKRKPRVEEPLLKETEEEILAATIRRLRAKGEMSREDIQNWEEERERIKKEAATHPSRGGKRRKTRRKKKSRRRRK